MPENLPYGDRPGERTQHGVAPDRGQSFANLRADARGAHLRRVVRSGADAAQDPGRKQKRQRIEQYRERRREPLDQRTGDSGTDELRGGIAHPILAFASTRLPRPTLSVMNTW